MNIVVHANFYPKLGLLSGQHQACLEAPLSLKNRKSNSSVLKNLALLFPGTTNRLKTMALE